MTQDGSIGIENKAFTFPGEDELLSKIDSGAVEVSLVGDFAGRMFTSTFILTKIIHAFQSETDSIGRARRFLKQTLLIVEPKPNEKELRILQDSLEDRLKELPIIRDVCTQCRTGLVTELASC
ncbi:MAG: hypothetical protein WCL23_03100 [Candidatus Moraniibacteriota bacterium]